MGLRILNIINSMGIGGAEKLLVDILPMYNLHSENLVVDLLLLNGRRTFFLDALKSNFKGKIISLGVRSVYNIWHIFKICKYINKYDVIHVHLFPSLYFVSIAKFILNSKVKLIFTEHNTVNKRINSGFFRCIDRLIYRNYALITAISPEVKDVLVRKLKLRNKIEIIYNGIKLEKFEQAKPNIIDTKFEDGKDKILIQVSRFSIQKDQQTVIRAMTHLPNFVKLILVGDGELKTTCEQLVVTLGLEKRVRFLGIRDDIPSLLRASDIVVQSSIWEGFGIAAVEGMAAEKPVLSSDVPGLREIIDNAGLLFTKGDDAELARLIINLLEDRDYYSDVAAKCVSRAQRFDIGIMVQKFINIYESV